MNDSGRYTRSCLLDDFRVEAEKWVAASSYNLDLTSLLAKLVLMVPQDGFDLQTPVNTIEIVGDVDEAMAMAFYGEAMNAHAILPPEEPIQIRLSTDGGDATAGYDMITTISELRRAGRQVNCHVTGVAFSMGFYLVQSCDIRTAEHTSMLMAHHEQFGIEGSAQNHKNEAEASIAHTKSMLEIICKRTGRPMEYYTKKILGGEWYMSAAEALAEGLLDQVKPMPTYSPSPYLKKPRAPRKKKEKIEETDGSSTKKE